MNQAYGAWAEKKMMGKTYMGTLRISYLIGPDGKVAKVYPEVDPANHALQLLADIKTIRREEKKAAKLAVT